MEEIPETVSKCVSMSASYPAVMEFDDFDEVMVQLKAKGLSN